MLNHVEMTTSDDQYSYIATVLSKTGWSQTDLAHRSGLDPSTLSRFLTKTRDGRALRASSVQRIARITGIAFGDIVPANENSFSEGEAAPYEYALENELDAAIRALCQNRENTDAWILKSRALENAGYRIDDVLIVGLGQPPFAGDVVCAQIYNWSTGEAETIFRIYQPPALISSSNDPETQKPFLLSDSAVSVKGIVLHSVRTR
jgi:transcriptional regulator with XRE-family HTH domain